jgi:hypothetical protein
MRASPSGSNLHQFLMQIEAQIPTQVEAYVQLLRVTLVAKSWLLKVRRVNLQHQELHRWLLQQEVVEFNALSVEAVIIL